MSDINWNNEQWERFEFVDIMHDMTDSGGLKDVNKNNLLNKCLEELGYKKYQNATPISSTKKYEDTDSIKFGTIKSPNVDFSQDTFTKDKLYKMRDLLDFAVIKYFFIDAAHTAGKTSYSGDPPAGLEENYSSYFDYSIINDQKLAEVSHKATTANVCDPATTSVFMDQIIDEDGSQIIYSKTDTSKGNKIYYGFPYGSIVQTKIIKKDEAGLTKGCYIYVQYNTDTKNKVYKFSAFYKIDFEEDTSTSISREKFVKNPHVTYYRVDYTDVLKTKFNLDDIPYNCQKTDNCVKSVINLSNSEKASYFYDNKDQEKDNADHVKYIKQGIEYIVLKAYGDRNQSSFLKEINEDSETIYNSSNTCILSTDSHLIQAAAHTSHKNDYRIQCVYKHNADGNIIVDSVINKDTKKSIVSYQNIIAEKCKPSANSLLEPKIEVDFAQSDVGIEPMRETADLIIKNHDIPYAIININKNIFNDDSSNVSESESGNKRPRFTKKVPLWYQVKTYLANFFNILIKRNNELVESVIRKIRESVYYTTFIMAKDKVDNEYLELLQKFNDFIDALLSLIIEKELSKYMKDKDNLFTLFPLIYNKQYGSLSGEKKLTSSLIQDEANSYFDLISVNENFKDIINKKNTNSLYILILLDNFIGGEDFLANFLKNIDFIYDSIRPEYEWFTKFESEFPTGHVDSGDGGGVDYPMLGGNQKGGGDLEEAIYNKLYHNNDNIFFLKFLYLLNLDYSTIKNSTIISTILSYKIQNDEAAAMDVDYKMPTTTPPTTTPTKPIQILSVNAKGMDIVNEHEHEQSLENKPTSPPPPPSHGQNIQKRSRRGGATKKRKKTNKKIQTLKKKLTKKIKKMKENFKKQVIKLNLRKYNRTPKKNKLLTTIKRRKNKKDKKTKKNKK